MVGRICAPCTLATQYASWWGDRLGQRGDLDRAIAEYQLADQKGPKFADPLEGWGEALVGKATSPARWRSSRRPIRTPLGG
jgi:hypothetical protein